MTSRLEKIALNEFGNVRRNLSPALLYEDAITQNDGEIVAMGALATRSFEKTGRSPKDKRIIESDSTNGDVWWGEVNIKMSRESFALIKQQAAKVLDDADNIYVVDGFAGWDEDCRIKVRIICTRPYHALFMHNMLIRPTADELSSFGEPDYVIYNAGHAPADQSIPGVTSSTSISLDFETGEMVILGSQYAGEMKKGVFTIMNYLMPKTGVLSMHCSANEGNQGDVSLFFGLSGTGKTTLSADPRRKLIGDDEHCWTENGVFNIEGGCYAKCIDLSAEKEPEIFGAVRFGSVLENTVYDPQTRQVDFHDTSLTQNTRVSYPIEYIDNAKIPCVGGHPRNIVFLTCDAFGVLPPVSRLSPEQAMYQFISGYTAKVAGTEQGVTEPEATFSACYGAAFLVWHPTKYAEMLAEKMSEHGTNAWLVNTGWTGGAYGTGTRIELKYTRAIIDAIHLGELNKVEYQTESAFGLSIPVSCPGCPDELLSPRETWQSSEAYDLQAQTLSALFSSNFDKYGGKPEAADSPKEAVTPMINLNYDVSPLQGRATA